ncbi:MAG TPA: ATP-binding protein, partial [Candidatus Dormibacteraeota bacterium]|nr:ATP-binding protein [Candidatus Dormibacteraeota bacterium]
HLITLRLDPALPCISGDRDRLMQVLTNLLSNAVKYSPNGGRIVVAIRAEDAHVTVSVQDQGCGIPPEFMDQLFDRYERYETKLTRMIVGTGLGLVITRRIVEAHGGRVWADSKVGVGSEFHFSLPLTKKGSD